MSSCLVTQQIHISEGAKIIVIYAGKDDRGRGGQSLFCEKNDGVATFLEEKNDGANAFLTKK